MGRSTALTQPTPARGLRSALRCARMSPSDRAPPRPVEVARYAPNHHAEVVALVTGIQTHEFAIRITLAEQPDLLDVEGFYRRGAGAFWVALDAAHVVGTVGLVDGGDGTASLR